MLSASRLGPGGLVAVVVLVMVVPELLTLASWQQQNSSCSSTTTTGVGADSSVPLPAGAVGAERTVRMGTWNVLKSNSNAPHHHRPAGVGDSRC